MTSQIICDVTDVHYDAKKPSASENLSYSNRVLARSLVTRLRGKRGKLNYNRFFPEPTHNFLDHPSNQEVGPRGQTVPHNISNVRSTTRNCKISYSAPRASERGSMHPMKSWGFSRMRKQWIPGHFSLLPRGMGTRLPVYITG